MIRRIIVGLFALIGFTALLFLGAPATASSAGEPSSMYWSMGPVLDQGGTSECVGFALGALLQSSPNAYTPGTVPSPYWIYTAAQARDQWRDRPHEGTSAEAGFSYLQQMGYIDSVTYSHNAQEVADYLLTQGPVAMGTEWDYSMDVPDATGVITPYGSIRGYHEWLLTGYDRVSQMFTARNSWGPEFALGGNFRISLWNVSVLLTNEDAPQNREAALPHKNVTTWLQRQI